MGEELWRKLKIPMPMIISEYVIRHSEQRFLMLIIIDQFRYIKIQPNTTDLSTRLWGINHTNSVVIPQSLVLRSIVYG